jgi:hypothetical protein
MKWPSWNGSIATALDDETFETREEELLERLLEARKYHQRKQEQGGT